MMISLNKYKSTSFEYISTRRISNIITDIEEYNAIVTLCHELTDYEYKLNVNHKLAEKKIIRDGWFLDDLESTNTFAICLIYNGKLYKWVFHPGYNSEEVKQVTGLDALKHIKKCCGKELEPYAVYTREEMKEIKDQIEKPLIKLNNTNMIKWGSWLEEEAYVLKGVHHIDIHSAWPAALLRAHPDMIRLKKCYEELYVDRKINDDSKFKLNASIGAMQSYKILPGYPQLAKDAINGNNKYMQELIIKLQKAGFMVIALNTDGIFYTDLNNPNRLYHDENEGNGMGQWRHDHHFDKIRFKSAGAYEYVENGEYHAIVRGIPLEKSRKFVWGDIFKHHPKIYTRDNLGYVTGTDMTKEQYVEVYENGEIEE